MLFFREIAHSSRDFLICPVRAGFLLPFLPSLPSGFLYTMCPYRIAYRLQKDRSFRGIRHDR